MFLFFYDHFLNVKKMVFNLKGISKIFKIKIFRFKIKN